MTRLLHERTPPKNIYKILQTEDRVLRNHLIAKDLGKMRSYNEHLINYLRNQNKRLEILKKVLLRKDDNRTHSNRSKRRTQQTPCELTDSSSDTGFVDRNKKRIRIGDTVEIITKGKFNSDQGEILSAKDCRLVIKDNDGCEITRAPKNLIVKNEDFSDISTDGTVDSEGRTEFDRQWGVKEETQGN